MTDPVPPDGQHPADGDRAPNGSSPRPRDADGLRRPDALLFAASLAVLACVLLFAVLAAAVRQGQPFSIDSVGNEDLHALASPALDLIMATATFVGTNPVLLVMSAGIAILLVAAHRRREALFLGVVVVGSILLNTALKLVFQRPRPDLPWATAPAGYSFPSGHAMNSMAFALGVGIVAWRVLGPRWGAAAVVVGVASSGLIGLSRIYLGYHYVTDVVAGFAAAVVWVAIVVLAFRAPASSSGNSRS